MKKEVVLTEDIPSISIVIPTYDSERTLAQCLESIICQDYPMEKIEIIIADGGSRDRTLSIARKYGVDKIVYNPLKTGEAGKAAGVSVAENELILFQDSDNLLENCGWLKRMVEPFQVSSVVGVEPLYYTYRRRDPQITRYCALIGMNDPLCLYLGNYDRYSYVTGKWTEVSVRVKNKRNYILVELNEEEVPTLGANGFLVRADMLKRLNYQPYLFDIDIVYQLVKNGKNKFAKVKIGIVHLFANDVRTFIKKTYRRIRDYLYYEKNALRDYPWKMNKSKMLKFVLFTLLLLPAVRDLVRGYKKVPDRAWLFHPLACHLTLLVYGIGFACNLMWRKWAK